MYCTYDGLEDVRRCLKDLCNYVYVNNYYHVPLDLWGHIVSVTSVQIYLNATNIAFKIKIINSGVMPILRYWAKSSIRGDEL